MKSTCKLAGKGLRLPFLLLGFWASLSSSAQLIRGFSLIYSDNLKGGHTLFGNTITAIYSSGSGSTGTINTTAMNDFGSYSYGATSNYLNDNSNIQLLDVDGTGTPSTTSSSSADLVMPAGSNTIKFARLYWGGRIKSGNGGADNINLRSVKIRKGTSGSYQSIVAPSTQIDKSQVSGTDSTYQAYIDVTAFINSNGAGTYTVADIKAATGSISGGGYFGGWGIVVVYQNDTQPYCSIRLYDGYMQVYDGGSPVTQSITLTGLNAPDSVLATSDAVMTTFTWEGDANLAASPGNPAGDFIRLNNVLASNAVNPITNFWNGTISKNGSFVTTKNPDFKNQMSVDIDEVYVGSGYGILPGASTVSVEFGTEADQYFPSVFAFSLKSKDPTVILDKAVVSSLPPFDLLNPSEYLTYTITGINTGLGHALNCVITDTIPHTLTYVPGSLVINSSPGGIAGPKTDADGDDQAMLGTDGTKTYVKFFIGEGAVSGAGGILHPVDSFSVQFKCLTPPTANALQSVSNTARITGVSNAGDPFVDDGTALIGPAGSPLSVKLTAFTVRRDNNYAILNWTTQSETQNDRFEIEKSFDGIQFTKTGTVTGSGTTLIQHDYTYNDPVNDVTRQMIYYRLRVIDLDGRFSFSKIIVLRVNESSVLKSFQVFPNPFTSDIKVCIYSIRETGISIRISNMSGQVMVRRSVMLQPGQNIVVVSDLSGLPAGVHLMEIYTGEGKLTQKISKQ